MLQIDQHITLKRDVRFDEIPIKASGAQPIWNPRVVDQRLFHFLLNIWYYIVTFTFFK